MFRDLIYILLISCSIYGVNAIAAPEIASTEAVGTEPTGAKVMAKESMSAGSSTRGTTSNSATSTSTSNGASNSTFNKSSATNITRSSLSPKPSRENAPGEQNADGSAARPSSQVTDQSQRANTPSNILSTTKAGTRKAEANKQNGSTLYESTEKNAEALTPRNNQSTHYPQSEWQQAQPQAYKLQRGGSLLNQALPSAPPTVRNRSEKSSKRLRQILITTKDMATAEKQRRQLAVLGVTIKARKHLPNLGMVISTYRLAEELMPEETRQQVQSLLPDHSVEINQSFQLLGGNPKHYGQRMVALNSPSRCQQPLTLAMLDSGVNTRVASLENSNIVTYNVTNKKELSAQHGTAVATLLVSTNEEFMGIVPNAVLHAVNVFAVENEHVLTQTDWLLYGLDVVAGLSPVPDAVNMSFGGDYSAMIEKVLDKLSEKTIFVAAAGNDGSDERLYPAAYSAVHAVGSITVNGDRSRLSNYGEHVSLVAPGEDIWTSNAKGQGYYATGTSFAAPFATAALALVHERKHSIDSYLAGLSLREEGQHLVSFSGICI